MADDVDVAQSNAERYIASAIHGVKRAIAPLPVDAVVECEDCGDDIPKERRQAVPWTKTCVDCAGRREREARGR